MQHVPAAEQNVNVPFRMQPSSLGYDSYLGRLAVGRVFEGKVNIGHRVYVKTQDGKKREGKITKIFIMQGLKRAEVLEAVSGDIVMIAGIPDIYVGETISTDENAELLPVITIDPPTISMLFLVNNSPFAGNEGSLVTTRHIRSRLEKERETNVGLHIEEVPGTDAYKVSGRGELHLSVLIEDMRREGFELQVSRPEVILRDNHGIKEEPIEQAIIDVPESYTGTVIDIMARRKGEMISMQTAHDPAFAEATASRHTRLEFMIPTRGLLGLRGDFIIETCGEGILTHSFVRYDPYKGNLPERTRGSMISMENGTAVAFALWKLQERGQLFIVPQTHVYEGMIIGESAKNEDMAVNPTKEKKLTNMRASGSDDAILLKPVRPMTLEQALEYIADDELVEITPKSVRLRKKFLREFERKRSR